MSEPVAVPSQVATSSGARFDLRGLAPAEAVAALSSDRGSRSRVTGWSLLRGRGPFLAYRPRRQAPRCRAGRAAAIVRRPGADVREARASRRIEPRSVPRHASRVSSAGCSTKCLPSRPPRCARSSSARSLRPVDELFEYFDERPVASASVPGAGARGPIARRAGGSAREEKYHAVGGVAVLRGVTFA